MKVNPSANTSDNRLTGYGYDESGNMTKDAGNTSTSDPNKRRYTYDGENKQTLVERFDSSGVNPIGTIGEYFYDGDGKRVKKITYNQYSQPVETTIFVYDAMGKLVAEYSTNPPVQASEAKVGYLTNDHLGSPRIITDQNGNVTSRRDFLPFGEEIGVNVTQTAGRNSHSQYAGDNTRQKFTGYERDTETSLDYAKARMHSYNHGRFTSPDPLMASANRANPQTWNRYIYVGNNPLKYIDPTGLEWGYYDKGGKRHFRWFDGKAGTYKGRRYQTYTGSMTVNAVGIGWIHLNNNGTYSRILTWNGIPRGTVSPQDAEIIKNATGGLLCSGSAGLLCFGDKNSKEFQNAMSGADAVQYASMVKSLIAAGVSLAVIAAIIKSNPDDVAALARAITFKGFSKGSLAEHFGKHGSEFGNITQSQYLKMAKDFAAKSGDDIVEGVEGNFYVKYNQTTRETLVGHIKDREIRTYYVDDGRNADPFQAAIELARSLGGN